MIKSPVRHKTKADDHPAPALTALQGQVVDLHNKWCRAMADYQNLEKRVQSEKEQLTKYLNAVLIEKLLSIVDDLERAVTHLQDPGIKIILDKFRAVLFSEGVTEMDILGQPFDPRAMNCTEMVSGKANHVIAIMEKGYLLHGRLLRPAKVKVGKGDSPVPPKQADK